MIFVPRVSPEKICTIKGTRENMAGRSSMPSLKICDKTVKIEGEGSQLVGPNMPKNAEFIVYGF